MKLTEQLDRLARFEATSYPVVRQQTGARITFIEDASLLERYGGVAALLRYRI